MRVFQDTGEAAVSAPVTFSVIVVCKDAGEKLLSTVKSALAQTYPHFEILVKDGMSAEDPHVTLAKLGVAAGAAKKANPNPSQRAGSPAGHASQEMPGASAASGPCAAVSESACAALPQSAMPLPEGGKTADSTAPQEMPGGSAVSGPCAASQSPSLRILITPDTGIYDAMNQAVSAASGDYFLFLNCGDSFASPDVLAKTAAYLGEHPDVLLPYGHRINGLTGVLEYAPQAITPFILFRGLPCHQACFYHRSLFAERGYDTKYRVRADYEHFFYCYYIGAAQASGAVHGSAGAAPAQASGAVHGSADGVPAQNAGAAKIRLMDFPVCVYEGGGFSETPANLKVSAREHREICSRYFTPLQHFKYRLWPVLTLQPLRKKLADSRFFGALYQKLKRAAGK